MTARLPDPLRSRVVLIGASTYADSKLPDLPAVTRTLRDLKAALTDPVSGVASKSSCVLLANPRNLGHVGRSLQLAAVTAEDLLLVYYVGHGVTAGRRHDLYLALPDTHWDAPEFSALEYDKVRNAVLDSPAATKMIVLDCCYSGRVLGDSMAEPLTELISQSEITGSYVLASAPRDRVSLILPGEERTAFTGRLLDLLRNGLPGAGEFLTADDVYRRLRAQMKAEGLPEPQKRSSATADRLILALNHAFAVPPPQRSDEAAALFSRASDPISAPPEPEQPHIPTPAVRVHGHVLWALTPVLSLGLLLPAPCVHAAIRMRNLELWVVALLYITLWLTIVTIIIYQGSLGRESDAVGASIWLFIIAAVASAHALRLRHQVFGSGLGPR